MKLLAIYRTILLAGLFILIPIGFSQQVDFSASSFDKKTDDNFRISQSKYKSIKTKHSSTNSSTHLVDISLPVTKSLSINRIIDGEADRLESDFFRRTSNRYPVNGERFTLKIDYRIVRIADGFVSILLESTSDIQDAEPIRSFSYWTFDLVNNREITLDDLFGKPGSDGRARLALYLKQRTLTVARQTDMQLDTFKLNALLGSNDFASFLTPSDDKLRFVFNAGEIAPVADGPLVVDVSIARLQLFLQTSSARRILSVSRILPAKEFTPKTPTKTSIDCSYARCVALTFDDGPGPYTEQLLSYLKSAKVHASFFLVGKNVEKYPEIVRQIKAEGHTIGNHTWRHRDLSYLTPSQTDNEITTANQIIESVTGDKPHYLRPPNGSVNSQVYKSLARLQMTGVLWSVDTRDWADRDGTIIANRIMSATRRGSIIILHDIHPTTVRAVPQIIRDLKRSGYALVSLDEMFGKNPMPGSLINRADEK